MKFPARLFVTALLSASLCIDGVYAFEAKLDFADRQSLFIDAMSEVNYINLSEVGEVLAIAAKLGVPASIEFDNSPLLEVYNSPQSCENEESKVWYENFENATSVDMVQMWSETNSIWAKTQDDNAFTHNATDSGVIFFNNDALNKVSNDVFTKEHVGRRKGYIVSGQGLTSVVQYDVPGIKGFVVAKRATPSEFCFGNPMCLNDLQNGWAAIPEPSKPKSITCMGATITDPSVIGSVQGLLEKSAENIAGTWTRKLNEGTFTDPDMENITLMDLRPSTNAQAQMQDPPELPSGNTMERVKKYLDEKDVEQMMSGEAHLHFGQAGKGVTVGVRFPFRYP